MRNGDRVTAGDKDFTATEVQETREEVSPRMKVVRGHALLVPADEEPVQRDDEALDDWHPRREDLMFGPQDADLDEEGE
jgi:hypothetical protein